MRAFLRHGAWLLPGTLALVAATTSLAQEGVDDALLTRMSVFHQQQQALGSLAEERVESSDIRELAEEIAMDHHLLEEWLQEAGHAAQGDDAVPGGSDDASGEAAELFEELKAREGAGFDTHFLDYQEKVHEQALAHLEENRPENIEQSERANHLKITHEALRKHLGMIQEHRQGDEGEGD